MEGIARQQPFIVQLENGLIERPQREILMKGDKNADVIAVLMKNGEENADLTGVTVSGTFVRPDGVDVPLEGSAEGGEARVALNEHCYAVEGRYEITVRLTLEETERTVLLISGTVRASGGGAILDVENVIPSIEDIAAQLETMRQATQEAQDAAEEARNAAIIRLKGRYDTLEQLQAAHPTGAAGDAWAVGTAGSDVIAYIWDVDRNRWESIGSIQSAGTGGSVTINGVTASTFTLDAASVGAVPESRVDQDLTTTSSVTFNTVTANKIVGAVYA